jgi:predicted NAD/FAD-binding protein
MAGLAAALRLAGRDRDVVLHEQTRIAGGRCRTFRDTGLGQTLDNGIDTRQAKVAMGATTNKIGRNDARGLAQIMRTGWYRTVRVKSLSCRSLRALLMARRMVLNKRRGVYTTTSLVS